MQEEFKNADNTGRLFSENQVQCVRKGTINVGGEEGYYSVLLFTKRNDAGEIEYQKYELAKSVGRLYINEKKNENSPDIDGPVTIDGKQWKCCGWKKEASNGKEFTKIAMYEKDAIEPTGVLEKSDAPFPQDTLTEDDIPF
jgi:hypothetical protein